MSNLMEELFLRLACETPLPQSRTARRTTNTPLIARPYTRAQARVDQQGASPPGPRPQPTATGKKRSRKPEFGIFVDANAANASFYPSPKKLKSNERLPLAARVDSGNATPVPSPRCPDTPWPFSPSDPLWEGKENFDPRPCYVTPPPTSRSFLPTPSPSPQPSPRRGPARTSRPRQTQRAPAYGQLSPPRDMALYTALGLNNWRATNREIRAAHQRFALEHHPDKVALGMRKEATHLMQIANAAAEVLLNDERRQEYHRDGRLPWTT